VAAVPVRGETTLESEKNWFLPNIVDALINE
jgi:hypothetical protein